MGEPDNHKEFVQLVAGDLGIYVSREIWDALKPGQSKLIVAVAGYGRFWLHLEPPLPFPYQSELQDGC
jgi:hypothetical protein